MSQSILHGYDYVLPNIIYGCPVSLIKQLVKYYKSCFRKILITFDRLIICYRQSNFVNEINSLYHYINIIIRPIYMVTVSWGLIRSQNHKMFYSTYSINQFYWQSSKAPSAWRWISVYTFMSEWHASLVIKIISRSSSDILETLKGFLVLYEMSVLLLIKWYQSLYDK